jgi:hypothetical protein
LFVKVVVVVIVVVVEVLVVIVVEVETSEQLRSVEVVPAFNSVAPVGHGVCRTHAGILPNRNVPALHSKHFLSRAAFGGESSTSPA